MTSPRVRRLATALIAAVAPLGLVSACAGSSGTTVTAQFHDAAGLFTGNDVGVLGVRVGEVTEITPRGAHVDVQLQIDDGVKIPADASAVVVSRSPRCTREVPCSPAAR
jgi:ABC-type transporter Mla subunit MlaD